MAGATCLTNLSPPAAASTPGAGRRAAACSSRRASSPRSRPPGRPGRPRCRRCRAARWRSSAARRLPSRCRHRGSRSGNALARADRGGELVRGLVLVLAVGEQDGVPQRGRAGLEDLLRQPQPLADRGAAVGAQPAQRLLASARVRSLGHRHRPVRAGRPARRSTCRHDREPRPVLDHVDRGRGGGAGLGYLGRREVHRPGAVDDDDLGAAARPGSRRRRRASPPPSAVTVTIALTSLPPPAGKGSGRCPRRIRAGLSSFLLVRGSAE